MGFCMKINILGAFANRKTRFAIIAAGVLLGGFVMFSGGGQKPSASSEKTAQAKAALTVSLVSPIAAEWPQVLPANGNVVPWQEAIIGPEINNYRITEVLVQIGDQVKKGDLLARIASDTVASELAESKAAVAELQASAAEAKSNAERAKELKAQGFYSTQLNAQYQTSEHTAAARLAAAKARSQAAELKMRKTSVVAPDDGVISARSATVGSLTQQGQELFRLIRGGRLEWRAEVPSADMARLKPGLVARLTNPNGEVVEGRVRTVAPSVDPQTRNGLIYVDLLPDSAIRAGMFARGEFVLTNSPALTLPQSAVVLREGFAYVFRLEGSDRVAQTKLVLGRRVDDRIEVLSGLSADAKVVETGASFLADGDAVKVVEGSQKP